MEQRNDLTTGEMIALLRGFREGDLGQDIADRLESQEHELSGISGELKVMATRAEKAERERDNALAMLQDICGCDECEHLTRRWDEEPCNKCSFVYLRK